MASVLPSIQYHVNRSGPACGAAGHAQDIRGGLSLEVNSGSSSFLGKSDFWWVIGDPMKWRGDRRIWDHGTGP